MKMDLNQAAKEIFAHAVRSVDAREAVRRVVAVNNHKLLIRDSEFDLSGREVYSVAIGKAGAAMAVGLSDVLGSKLKGGIVSAPSIPELAADRWRLFSGGHPLPTAESLAAAQSTIDMLKGLEDNALVIFLISGGGSAMFELPVDDEITIDDLRQANRQLVSCGASIVEVNAVRRAFSAVKGGKLARCAPETDQVTLIVSDTNGGDEASVASGPTLDPVADAPTASAVLEHYELESSLPQSILRAIKREQQQRRDNTDRIRAHYVLLDNQTALDAAATRAQQLGFEVEIALDISEQEIERGCALLISRAYALAQKYQGSGRAICLISGGEFSCPVRGDGLGGRNSETALRCAMKLRDTSNTEGRFQWSVLSAGTDGLDGNSPAAGALGDETTIKRGESAGLNAADFLELSDSFSYFKGLGGDLLTGPTGTNVRDVRLVLVQECNELIREHNPQISQITPI